MTTDAIPPPHDLDAEAAVLSAIVLHPEAIADVEPIMGPADCYSVANRKIAETIWALDASGEPIDIATIANRLKARGELQRIGGTPYLSQIIEATPAVAHVEAHARIVADLAAVRLLQNQCAAIRAEGFGEIEDVRAWLSDSERRLFSAFDHRRDDQTQSTIADGIREEVDALERQSGELVGLPTGLQGLDDLLGGIVDGVPYVIAGRPGLGKTALATQIVRHVAPILQGQGRCVFFASQEMPREQLVQRMIAQEGPVPMTALTRRQPGDHWQRITDAAITLSKLPIVIDDKPAQTPHGLRSAVRRATRRLDGSPRPGLIVVDYLQLERVPGLPKQATREQEVSEAMRGNREMAKEFGCPVLVLSQLNRKVDERPGKRPQLSDLRESGAIEQDAYSIVFLCPDEDFIVAKNRNGRTGEAHYRFDGSCVKFYDREDNTAPDEHYQREMYDRQQERRYE